MISVNDAERLILQGKQLFPVESIPLEKAVGRVLREDIKNDRDQPPYNKCLMDGVAVYFDTWQKGIRVFPIEATVRAGIVPKPLKNYLNGVRIMTGAVLPKGCDCVVPVEQIIDEGNLVRLRDWTIIKKHQNIRSQAADGKKNELLIRSGEVLLSPHIGVAASVGKSIIKVTGIPKIAVISTGDELVAIAKAIKPHQTRWSNAYALQSLLTQTNLGVGHIIHLRDEPKRMVKVLKNVIRDFDVIILSGGVSMGEFDYVPKILNQLGVKKVFHTVAQKPGKPLWFGLTRHKKPVFALPGNPVSTQICAYRYIIPLLQKASGRIVKGQVMAIHEEVAIKSDLTHFLPVHQGRLVPIGGSGDFAALARADGFIQYDSSTHETTWPYFSWRV